MNRIYLMIIMAIAWVHASPAKVQNVAVLPITQSVNPSDGALLASQMESGLFNAKTYRVLERGQMNVILQEQGFQQSGVCDGNSCDVQIGKLLGVDKVVATIVSYTSNGIMITAKLIDVQTGIIDRTATFQGNGSLSSLAQKAGEDIGRKLSGVAEPEAVPAYKTKSFWIIMGAVAILMPVLFYEKTETKTETSKRTVRFE